MIEVLIVDDQELLRDGIRTLLELETDFKVVAMARNGEEAIDLFDRLRPDVVLMDIRMPVLDGISATKQILALDDHARVLVLTTFAEDSLLFDALRAGARGYLLKDASAAELAAAIREVQRGNAALEPGIAMRLIQAVRTSPAEASPDTRSSDRAPSAPPAPLHAPRPNTSPGRPFSRRELDVLRLIAEGFSNKEIAERLFLAEGTVKNRVSDILAKIDARDRTQAALRARELELL